MKNKIGKSIEDKVFESAIKEKNVAVVGNGTQEIGKFKEKEIDFHDIVIRYNNF